MKRPSSNRRLSRGPNDSTLRLCTRSSGVRTRTAKSKRTTALIGMWELAGEMPWSAAKNRETKCHLSSAAYAKEDERRLGFSRLAICPMLGPVQAGPSTQGRFDVDNRSAVHHLHGSDP